MNKNGNYRDVDLPQKDGEPAVSLIQGDDGRIYVLNICFGDNPADPRTLYPALAQFQQAMSGSGLVMQMGTPRRAPFPLGLGQERALTAAAMQAQPQPEQKKSGCTNCEGR